MTYPDYPALHLTEQELADAITAAGSVVQAARRLGIPRSTLHYHLNRLGIRIAQEPARTTAYTWATDPLRGGRKK